jgi:hypothetical protein
MDRDRRTLLQLVAVGRLNPAEAERLIAAQTFHREDAWLLPACLLMLVLPHHAPLHALLGGVYLFFSHLPGSIGYLGQIFSQLHHLTGGLS